MGWVFLLPLGILVLLLFKFLLKYRHSPPRMLGIALLLSLVPISYLLIVSNLISATSFENEFDLIITRLIYPFMYLAFIGGIVSLVSLSVYGVATFLKKRTN